MPEAFFFLFLSGTALAALVLAIYTYRKMRGVLHQQEMLRSRLEYLSDQIRELLSGTASGSDSSESRVETFLRRRSESTATPEVPPHSPESQAAEEDAEEVVELTDVVEEPSAPEIEETPRKPYVQEEPPEPVIASFLPTDTEEKSTQEGAVHRSLEERLGGGLFVWIGAIALAMAGVYLVKYSIDQGWMRPSVRCLIGGGFGVALLGVGEWMRSRSRRIAEGLSAAGIADLFAILLAATNLYHLISPIWGFGGMAIVTGLAVVLSLRQGPFVAALGLAGGFLTPVLIQTGSASPRLFVYLFLLELGLLAVTHRRHWFILSGLTLVCSLGWAAAWLFAGYYQPDHALWLGFYLLGTVVLFSIATQFGDVAAAWKNSTIARVFSWCSIIGGLLLTGSMVQAGAFGTTEWVFFGVLSAGCMVFGRLRPACGGFAWIALGITTACLLGWVVQAGDLPDRYAWVLLSMGLLFGLGSYGLSWGAVRPARWLKLVVCSETIFMLLGYSIYNAPYDIRWSIWFAGLAVLDCLLAIPVFRFIRDDTHRREGLTELLTAMAILVGIAIPMEFRREWLGPAWSIELCVLAFAFAWLRTARIRILAGLLALPITVFLALNLDLPVDRIGTGLANCFWHGFGIPIVLFFVASWRMLGTRGIGGSTFLARLGFLYLFVLIAVQVRLYFHPEALFSSSFSLNETATLAIGWLLYGWIVLVVARPLKLPVVDQAGRAIVPLGLIMFIVGPLLLRNPLYVMSSVGTIPILNGLLAIYGIPAVLTALAGFALVRLKHEPQGYRYYLLSLVFGLILVFLEIRHCFHPEDMAVRSVSALEAVSLIGGTGLYSLVWAWVFRNSMIDVVREFGPYASGSIVLIALSVMGLMRNPLFHHESVGSMLILNHVLLLYGIPTLLAAGTAYYFLKRGPRVAARLCGVATLLFVFLLVSLEVRQSFQGEFLDDLKVFTDREKFAYSPAWLVLGGIYLAIAIPTRGLVLRYASLVTILLAVGKVFLLDTSHLEGLLRVLSFFGLGVSLIGIAWVYQKYVFRIGKDDGIANSLSGE